MTSCGLRLGSRVECCVGKDHWEPGTVVALWYTEEGFPPGFYAPYQVELDMGNLIFAPDDSDRCIRESAVDWRRGQRVGRGVMMMSCF